MGYIESWGVFEDGSACVGDKLKRSPKSDEGVRCQCSEAAATGFNTLREPHEACAVSCGSRYGKGGRAKWHMQDEVCKSQQATCLG